MLAYLGGKCWANSHPRDHEAKEHQFHPESPSTYCIHIHPVSMLSRAKASPLHHRTMLHRTSSPVQLHFPTPPNLVLLPPLPNEPTTEPATFHPLPVQSLSTQHGSGPMTEPTYHRTNLASITGPIPCQTNPRPLTTGPTSHRTKLRPNHPPLYNTEPTITGPNST